MPRSVHELLVSKTSVERVGFFYFKDVQIAENETKLN
jgi:hypothetical protein